MPGIIVTIEGGAISCTNDSDETVTLDLWGGPRVTVEPGVKFRGDPQANSKALLNVVTISDLEEALRDRAR